MHWLTRSPAPLMICMVLYVAMGFGFWHTGRKGLAITHWAYAAANIGLIMAWYEG